jgi:hypothetical protein
MAKACRRTGTTGTRPEWTAVNDIICALDNPIELSAIRRDDAFSGYRRRIKRTYTAEKHAQDK